MNGWRIESEHAASMQYNEGYPFRLYKFGPWWRLVARAQNALGAELIFATIDNAETVRDAIEGAARVFTTLGALKVLP